MAIAPYWCSCKKPDDTGPCYKRGKCSFSAAFAEEGPYRVLVESPAFLYDPDGGDQPPYQALSDPGAFPPGWTTPFDPPDPGPTGNRWLLEWYGKDTRDQIVAGDSDYPYRVVARMWIDIDDDASWKLELKTYGQAHDADGNPTEDAGPVLTTEKATVQGNCSGVFQDPTIDDNEFWYDWQHFQDPSVTETFDPKTVSWDGGTGRFRLGGDQDCNCADAVGTPGYGGGDWTEGPDDPDTGDPTWTPPDGAPSSASVSISGVEPCPCTNTSGSGIGGQNSVQASGDPGGDFDLDLIQPTTNGNVPSSGLTYQVFKETELSFVAYATADCSGDAFPNAPVPGRTQGVQVTLTIDDNGTELTMAAAYRDTDGSIHSGFATGSGTIPLLFQSRQACHLDGIDIVSRLLCNDPIVIGRGDTSLPWSGGSATVTFGGGGGNDFP